MTIVDLLRDAADALEDAYRGRDDVPPASLALIVAPRERVEHITSGKASLDEAEPTGALSLRTNRSALHFRAARDGVQHAAGYDLQRLPPRPCWRVFLAAHHASAHGCFRCLKNGVRTWRLAS
jgi:hypothetical protein